MNPQTPEPNPSKMDKGKGIDRSLHPRWDNFTNRHRPVVVRVSHAHDSRRRHPITASDEAQNNVSDFQDNRTMVVAHGAIDTNSLNTYTYDTLDGSGSGPGYNASNGMNSQSAFRGSGMPHRRRQQNSRSGEHDDLVDRTVNLSMNNQNPGNRYTPVRTNSMDPFGQSSGVLNNSQTSAEPSRAYDSTGRSGTNDNITVMHAGPSMGPGQHNGMHHSHVNGVMNGSTSNFGDSTAQTGVHLPSGPMGSFYASGLSSSPAAPGPQMTGQPQATIPNAVVIKNIPFKLLKEQLQEIIRRMGLPTAYAFDYLFQERIFRGLAFANYDTAEEATKVIKRLNGTEIWGRKLHVERKQEEPPEQRAENLRRRRAERGQTLDYHQTPTPGPVTVPPYVPPRGYSYLDPSPFSQPSTSRSSLNPTAPEFQPGSSHQLSGSAALPDDMGIDEEHSNFPRSTSPIIDPFGFDPESRRRQISQPSTSAAHANPWATESQLRQAATAAGHYLSAKQNRVPHEIGVQTIRRSLTTLPSSPANRQPIPARTAAPSTRIETRPYMRESWRREGVGSVVPAPQQPSMEQPAASALASPSRPQTPRFQTPQTSSMSQQAASTLASPSRSQHPPGLPTSQMPSMTQQAAPGLSSQGRPQTQDGFQTSRTSSLSTSSSQNTRRSSPGDPDYIHHLIAPFPAPAVRPTDAQPEVSPTTSGDELPAQALDPWFNAIWTRHAESHGDNLQRELRRERQREEREQAEREQAQREYIEREQAERLSEQAERAQGTDTRDSEDERADDNEELNINHAGSGETWLSLGRAFKRYGRVEYNPTRRSAA